MLLLLAIPFRLALSLVLPPWFVAGKHRSRLGFVAWYVMVVITFPISEVAVGWFQLLIGISKASPGK